MRKIELILILLFLGTLALYSQLPVKGDWTTRLGNDSHLAKDARTLYHKIFQSPNSPVIRGNEDKSVGLDFYESFKRLDDIAPYCTYYFYNGYLFEERENAELGRVEKSAFQRLLDNTQDPAIKMIIVDDILSVGKRFVTDLDSINVVRNNRDTTAKASDDTLSVPVAMIKYAHLYYKYAGNPDYYPSILYDKAKARENFRMAFALLREQNIEFAKELEAYYVYEYYLTCEELYNSDKEQYYEQFLEDYLDIIQTCDELLLPYYNIPDSIKNNIHNKEYSVYRSYNNFANNIQINQITGERILPIKYRFSQSGAANSERLESFYADRLGSHLNDTSFLERAVHLMTENGMVDNETYYRYCMASYKLRPTYENCIGMGKYVGTEDVSRMREYYLEALDDADTPEKKVIVYYMIGLSTYSSPLQYINNVKRDATTLRLKVKDGYSEWEKEMEIGNANLANVIEHADEIKDSRILEIRDYPARAHYMIGTNLRWKGYVDYNPQIFEEAKEHILKANSLDIKAKAITNSIGVNIPSVLSFIQKYSEESSASRKKLKKGGSAQSEFQDYLRRKKLEEAFWKMK